VTSIKAGWGVTVLEVESDSGERPASRTEPAATVASVTSRLAAVQMLASSGPVVGRRASGATPDRLNWRAAWFGDTRLRQLDGLV